MEIEEELKTMIETMKQVQNVADLRKASEKHLKFLRSPEWANYTKEHSHSKSVQEFTTEQRRVASLFAVPDYGLPEDETQKLVQMLYL